jgi:glutaconate CoA-transferase subunit B
MADFNPTELMACVASRVLEDGRSVLVGTGLPIIAGMLAQRLHAPNLLILFEAGGIGPRIPTIPISVGDSRTFHKAVMAASMDYVMSCAQLGLVDYGFLGAAQIDMYGNLNTTVIGDYAHPKVRLPGSGGGNDVGSLCWRNIILMRHDTRRFAERLDFVTTPGYLTGPGFHPESKRMTLVSIHPGVTVEDVIENTGFKLIIPDVVPTTDSPTAEELRLLRDEIDPTGIVLGK